MIIAFYHLFTTNAISEINKCYIEACYAFDIFLMTLYFLFLEIRNLFLISHQLSQFKHIEHSLKAGSTVHKFMFAVKSNCLSLNHHDLKQ